MYHMDETHDPVRQSWGASAHGGASDFPVQNLPSARFRRASHADDGWRYNLALWQAMSCVRSSGGQYP